MYFDHESIVKCVMQLITKTSILSSLIICRLFENTGLHGSERGESAVLQFFFSYLFEHIIFINKWHSNIPKNDKILVSLRYFEVV